MWGSCVASVSDVDVALEVIYTYLYMYIYISIHSMVSEFTRCSVLCKEEGSIHKLSMQWHHIDLYQVCIHLYVFVIF